eukprot:scaffold5326_cov136-Isochrysis_galbana.AAC.2
MLPTTEKRSRVSVRLSFGRVSAKGMRACNRFMTLLKRGVTDTEKAMRRGRVTVPKVARQRGQARLLAEAEPCKRDGQTRVQVGDEAIGEEGVDAELAQRRPVECIPLGQPRARAPRSGRRRGSRGRRRLGRSQQSTALAAVALGAQHVLRALQRDNRPSQRTSQS